jgi:uncharacterized repeat protein (TIGR01451 family)
VLTGSKITYTLTVINNGPGIATSVTVTDTLPTNAEIDLTSVSCSPSGGGVCTQLDNVLGITYPTLAANASVTITVMATVRCSLANNSVISNKATVSSGAPDPDKSNNSASVTTTVSNPPPMITCPPARDAVASNPGGVTAIVTYPSPMVMDNCPGATVVCAPPSGSAFPLGTTTVTCKATDSGGGTASCSFNITVWDVCIQDDHTGDFILFDSFTGDYKFVRCGLGGFTITGRGTVTRVGCVTRLEDDTRVSFAEIDRCQIAPKNMGSASIKRPIIGATFLLKDTNILNNTATCP